MQRSEIRQWLQVSDDAALQRLWHQADQTRRRHVGDAVHLRGLIEVSNYCARHCHYCGIRAPNTGVRRYRMTADEVVACAAQAHRFGYGTVVLQAGEDPALTTDWVTDVIGRITAETPLAITLSLGERTPAELAAWRAAGADRYLLRFETSNAELFARIHPPMGGRAADRRALLAELRRLDYEVGSGVMIGIPGQTWDDLARDIALFAELDLDMIGVGPFIPHPDTPLGAAPAAAAPEQVPADELTTYKVIALTRLVRPDANIPSTTALATLNQVNGRELGLQRGANIVMPNITPPQYRCLYDIYPNKACLSETAEQCEGCLKGRILAIGRTLGVGRGDARPRFRGTPAETAAAMSDVTRDG